MPEDFDIVETPVPEPGEGQVLVRARFLSLDPYMRGRMADVKSYAKPVALGAVMEGQTAGEVVASRHPGFAPGDTVLGGFGWQRFSVRRRRSGCSRCRQPIRRCRRASACSACRA